MERIQHRIVSIVTHSELLNLSLHNDNGNTKVELSETPWEWFGSGQTDPTWTTLFDDIETERNAHMIAG